MSRFSRVLTLIMIVVFALSVFTVEPDYVQGYENDDFPAFVESDAAFAIGRNEFAITIHYLTLAEKVPLPPDSRPISPPFISTNPSRGPPQSLVS